MRFTPERIKQEIVSPSRKITKTFLNLIYSSIRLISKIKNNGNGKCTLIWDIRSNPVTFDLPWLVLATSNYFKKYQADTFDVIIYIPLILFLSHLLMAVMISVYHPRILLTELIILLFHCLNRLTV